MRELEREFLEDDSACPSGALRTGHVLAIVGAGRLGTALTGALRGALPALEWEFAGPFGRGYDGRGADAVLLCVPDAEIAAAAKLVRRGTLVGHRSGATSL